MTDFPIPDFIKEMSAGNIHERMMNNLPDDIDASEGQFPHDYTYPAALQIAYACEYILIEALKLAFPPYSSGEHLRIHAQTNNLFVKEATFSKGTITVSGAAGTVIPLGAVFSTESTAAAESIDFATLIEAIIPNNGKVDIPIQCTEAGARGNVAVGTIVLKSSDLPSEITAVINAEALSGGTDEESEEALRERIADVEQTKGLSHVGSPSDYKRWAESVDGVGEALIISSSDNSGTVTIILTDANGEPASSELCEAVYNYIMGTKEDQSDRQVNINASLVVKAPKSVTLSISAKVYTDNSVSLSDIKAYFLENINAYLLSASETGTIRYSEICKLLLNTPGVYDYENVLVDGGTINISISKDELAVATASSITLTESV